MIPALTRRSKEGRLYGRPPEIQHCLETLVRQPVSERNAQLIEGATRDGTAIPVEAVVHFMRQAWRGKDEATFGVLFRRVTEQLSALTRAAIPDTRLPDAEKVRTAILEKFVDWVVEDCEGKNDRLDFFEMRAARGFVTLRVSVIRKARAAAKKQIETVPLAQKKADSEEDEVPAKLEAEATRLAAQISPRLDDPAFRSALYSAIDSLPAESKDVLLLNLGGMPIEVADPNTMTIVRQLKCTRRTVQNRYARGILALQKLLGGQANE